MSSVSESDRPNIVFINTDQQSYNMMSCAGNTYLKTPAMDRLAAEGVRFERAYCTNPVCLPSRFSFFTGRMPSEIDVWDNQGGRRATVPQHIVDHSVCALAKRAGYNVGYGGKVHLPGDMTPESMGCENITSDKRDGLADISSEWIRQRGKAGDGPFFLSVCFVNPHDICFMGMRDFVRNTRADADDLNKNEKWLLSDDSVEMTELNNAMALPDGVSEDEFYEKYCPPLPENHSRQNPEPSSITDHASQLGFRRYIREKWDDRMWRLHRWAYCRLTERVDGQIGKILQAIDDAGLSDNTLVIFTADHGDHDSSHKLEQKGTAYEEATRIPLLMRWPKRIKPGQLHAALVSNGLDILPTICEAVGSDCPDGLLGKSLLPLADERAAAETHQAIPLEFWLGRAVVSGGCKYVRYNDGDIREQLMDLRSDPREKADHIDQNHLREDMEKCKAAFERFWC